METTKSRHSGMVAMECLRVYENGMNELEDGIYNWGLWFTILYSGASKSDPNDTIVPERYDDSYLVWIALR